MRAVGRGRPHSIAGWLLQRVSGIFLFYALGVHLWTVPIRHEIFTTRVQSL